jgi:hypothetical protein
MRDILKIALGIVIGFIALAGCVFCAFLAFSAGGIALIANIPTSTPYAGDLYPSSTPWTLPSPPPTPGISQLGEAWEADGLSVSVSEADLSSCFTSEYGSEICPPDGAQYLWVHVDRENVRAEPELPIYSCFWITLQYLGDELEPQWGKAPDRSDWSGGGCGNLYAGHKDDGWVFFEVPAGIDLSQALLKIETYQGPHLERNWVLIITD